MNHFLKLSILGFALIISSCTSSAPDTAAEDDIMAIDEAASEVATDADAELAEVEGDFDAEPALEAAPAETSPAETAPAEASPAPADDLTAEFEQAEGSAPPAASDELTLEPEPAPAVEAEPTMPEPLSPEPLAPEEPAMTASASVNITDIKYLANQSGGSVLIEADGPVEYKSRFNPDANQFIIEVANAKLPNRLKRPYLMKDFEGAFGAINAYQQSGSSTARIVVQIKGKDSAEPTVSTEGNAIVVIPASEGSSIIAKIEEEPEPVPEKAEATIDEVRANRDERALGARTLDEFLTSSGNYYGKPISIQLKDADIRDVLNFIADQSGLNLVISEEVQGKISIKMREIPWDQALVTIMRTKKLGYLRQGNVIRISTLELLQAETDTARKILESQKAITPLRTRVFPVSFATVDDLTKNVSAFLTTGRGSVAADNRTSSLIVTDTEENLERISRLLRELDIPPAQVMIEGKIVEAGEEFSDSMGVNWSYGGAELNLSDAGGYRGGPLNFSTNMAVNNLGQSAESSSGIMAFNLNFGTIDILGDLNASLALAERNSLVKVLSSPRIVAMNKEKAQISQQGQQLTINQTTDQNGNVTKTVTRDPVTLDLSVTPQVTGDGSVIMDVQVKREFSGGVLDADTLARAINSRSAKTKILVKNAQTAVIGGIYQSDSTEGERGVPVLKDIPVLGWLFKSRNRDRVKNELLIFLTPKILNLKDQSVQDSKAG